MVGLTCGVGGRSSVLRFAVRLVPVRPWWVVAIALLSAGCNSDEVLGAEGEDTGTDEGEPLAGSVEVSRIELNPGVPIPVVYEGQLIPPESRNAKIPRGRGALMRVQLAVSEDWEARDVQLRLLLKDADGNEGEREKTLFVEGSSDPGDRETTFDFVLGAAEVTPGLEFAVELIDGEGAEPTTRLPEEGLYAAGVESDPMRMRVMFVPIAYNSGECESVGAPDPELAMELGNTIFQTFPLQSLDMFQRADPVVWNEQLDGNWGGLLQKLVNLRQADGVPPDMYYLALVDFCDEDPFVSAAAAGFPSPAPDDAYLRVGISSLHPTPQGGGGISGILFNLAVLNGRLTVPCPIGAGLDPSYPYEKGSIGGWGYGVIDEQLKDPGEYLDLAAGCMAPRRWTSDYTWRGLYEQVRAITSWAG